MACFAIEGTAGQEWSVVAVFAAADRKLKSMTLVRVSEWREVDPAQALAVLPPEPASASGSAAITCRSFEVVPLTGVWEGRLPPEHSQAEVFGWAPHRFVFKQSGDEMVSLGLPPFDEGMVVWTWLRSR